MALEHRIENGVLSGDNGYLFAMQDPAYLAILLGEKPVHEISLQHFAANMVSRAKKAQDISAQWAHIIIPDKPSTLSEEFPWSGVKAVGKQFADAGSSDRLIYPIELMRRGRENRLMRHGVPDRRFYNRLESHPEHGANVHLLRELLSRVGRSVPDELWAELFASTTMRASLGDLGYLVSSPELEDIEEPVVSWPMHVFENGASFMYDGAMALYLNAEAPFAERLLVFGDSCMGPIAFVASRLFREVLFCRTLFLHDEIVEGIKPDVLWTGHSDRYSWLCNDSERPIFLTMGGRCAAPQPERRDFWILLDAMLWSNREPHRFPYALTQALGRPW